MSTRKLAKQEQIDELMKCGSDPIYFIKNYLFIQHPEKGRIPFELFEFQEDCIKDFLKYKFNVVVKSRQLGLSTTAAAYCLWMAMFHEDRNILILATKLDVAKKIINKIRVTFKMLPGWMVGLLGLTEPEASSVKYMKLSNGSTITAEPTTENSGRSDALSLLVIDECVTGDTTIQIRNKTTGEIKTVEIQDLLSSEYNGSINQDLKLIDELEVLTPSGWSSFTGIKKTTKQEKYEILTEHSKLECSKGHKLKLRDGSFTPATELKPGDSLDNQNIVVSIKQTQETTDFFDLINVEKHNEYYTNNITSHNCAHIEGLEDIWVALKPALTVAKNAKVIAFSSPKGKANFFYKLYKEAETGVWEDDKKGFHAKGLGKNNFHAIKLPWTVHPDRDEKWFEEESKSMDAKAIAQEFMASFEQSGDTYFNIETMNNIEQELEEPLYHDGPNEKNIDALWIWKEVFSDHKYLLCGDVSRGDAQDFSAFHIINTTTWEQDAEFMGKIPPDKYADYMVEIAKRYGEAFIIQEKNSVGIATAIRLRDLKYPHVYWQDKSEDEQLYMSDEEKTMLFPGFTMKPGNKPGNRDELLINLEGILRNKQLLIRSRRFYSQMQDFIWNGKKGQAAKGRNDDLITSLAIGCHIVKPERNNVNKTDKEAPGSIPDFQNVFLQVMRRQNVNININLGQQTFNGVKLKPGVRSEAVAQQQQIKDMFSWMF